MWEYPWALFSVHFFLVDMTIYNDFEGLRPHVRVQMYSDDTDDYNAMQSKKVVTVFVKTDRKVIIIALIIVDVLLVCIIL